MDQISTSEHPAPHRDQKKLEVKTEKKKREKMLPESLRGTF